jgi:hypothetical protein
VGEPVVQHRTDWTALSDSLPHDPAAQARILETYRQQHGLPLLFPAGRDSVAVARLPLVVSDHACGPAVPAFVRTIPQDNPALGTRFVLEVDSAGSALQRWEVPLDVTVVGGGRERAACLTRPAARRCLFPNQAGRELHG